MTATRTTRAARWSGVLLLALAPVPWLGLGATTANAGDVVYATVTGYEPFSADANHADYWGENCEKIVDSGEMTSYVLTQDYELVVVKAASKNVDPYTNTLFADASSGETVWADTNGDGIYNPGGKGGDKAISHIIVCEGEDDHSSSAPAPSSSTATPSNTETESTGEASPSKTKTTKTKTTEVETSEEAKPNRTEKASESASAAAAALPKTGSGVPMAGALGASLLLIGIGVLLLLGPGRLVPVYHRKH